MLVVRVHNPGPTLGHNAVGATKASMVMPRPLFAKSAAKNPIRADGGKKGVFIDIADTLRWMSS